MSLKWWELAFTLNTADSSIAKLANGKEKLIPWIMMLASVCLITGIFLPVIKIHSFFIFTDRVSILDGIKSLFFEKEYFLAVIVALFSILFPALKISVADYAWRARSAQDNQPTRYD